VVFRLALKHAASNNKHSAFLPKLFKPAYRITILLKKKEHLLDDEMKICDVSKKCMGRGGRSRWVCNATIDKNEAKQTPKHDTKMHDTITERRIISYEYLGSNPPMPPPPKRPTKRHTHCGAQQKAGMKNASTHRVPT
jgi:hypothetical protein